jgi:DNA-binding MarR family transcriptional regulator
MKADAPTTERTAIKVEDLATLVAGISRFLTRLAKLPAFQDAGLGLAEWSALSIIAQNNGINSRQLANSLGVSAQRINQIAESLKVAGFITLTPDADDARKKNIEITGSGSERLQDLNAKLLPILTSALGKRERILRRTSHLINRTLMRVALHAKPGKRQLENSDTKTPAN